MDGTLKDFLVGVGFKLDEVSQRQAEDSIKKTEERGSARMKAEAAKREQAEKTDAASREQRQREAASKQEARDKKAFGAAQTAVVQAAAIANKTAALIAASTLGTFLGIDKAAKGFDRLTYVAKVAGASVANVTAFGYAASQLGSSKQEAEAALVAFGSKLKISQTGYERQLNELHIKTRDAAGRFRDNGDIATDLGDALKNIEKTKPFGYTQALGTGASLGFDENLVRALMNPEFRKREGEQKADQARIGADPNAAAVGATELEQSMRRLSAILDSVGTKIQEVLFVKLKPLLDQLATWFTQNGGRIADTVSRLADDLVRLATALAQQLAGLDWNAILDKIEVLAKTLGSLLGTLSGEKGLVLALGAFGLALAGLATLALPAWMLALLGVSAAGVALSVGSAKAEPSLSSGAGRSGVSGSGQGKGGRRAFGRRIGSGAQAAVPDAATTTRQHPADDRNFWQRHAPKVLGGKDPPTPETASRNSDPPAAADAGRVAGDLSSTATYGRKGEPIDPKALVIHHTGARGTPEGVVRTLNQRGLGVQYVMDRDGRVYRTLPNDTRGAHIRPSEVDGLPLSNGNTVGMEVIAKDDKDVTAAQVQAAKKFYAEQRRLHPGLEVYGHGYLNPGHKQATEGKTITDAIRASEGKGPLKVGDPIESARAAARGVPVNQRGFLGTYSGRDPSPARPLGDTPALHQSMLDTARGNAHLASGGVYNVKGGDVRSNLAAVRIMADHAHRDVLKRMAGENVG